MGRPIRIQKGNITANGGSSNGHSTGGLGGSGTVVREFSTDPLFLEDSNNIVPTQKAVTTFLATRLSEGGSEIETNQLTAGLVRLGGPGNVIEHTAGFEIQFPKTTNIAGPEAGITGNPLYMRLFLKDD